MKLYGAEAVIQILIGACLVAGVAELGVQWLFHRPGGRLNPHVWYSDVVNDPQGEAHYTQCLEEKKHDDPKALYVTVCDPPSHYAVIQLQTRGLKTRSNMPDLCIDIDYCIRHGESRVLPCQ